MKGITLISMMFMLLAVSFGQVNDAVGAIHVENPDQGKLPYKGQGFSLAKSNQSFVIPKLLNYQGYLTDNQGNPINNPSLSMTFAIYDASSSGAQLWTEDQTISVSKGIFNATLGSVAAIPNNVFRTGTDRWLELIVGGQTLTPRTRITSMGYAYTAIHSDTAEYAKNAAPLDLDTRYVNVQGPDSVYAVAGWTFKAKGDTAGYFVGEIYITDKATIGPNNTNTGTNAFVAGANNLVNNSYATVGGGYTNTASGTGATVGGGRYNQARGIYSVVSGGGGAVAADSNTAFGSHSAIGGGRRNNASGIATIVGGGYGNIASNDWTTVGGGNQNTASGYMATVAGGYSNTASGERAIVGGGYTNIASGYMATVVGGYSNTASDTGAIVGGGRYNQARGIYSVVSGGGGAVATDSNIAFGAYSAIGGGRRNNASGIAATVGGGQFNSADSGYATVGGGQGNTASNIYATVGGGFYNLAYDDYATIGGGRNNTAGGDYATVGGGYSNLTDTNYATIGGGYNNTASGYSATIGGGYNNTADTNYATIGGGASNTVSGYYATVGGGYSNLTDTNYATIGGGYNNTASGYSATIGGGYNNTASGERATVAGGYADTAEASCSFATNYSAKVNDYDTNSAAFTTSHTTAKNQVRAAAFSTGTLVFTMDHPKDPMNKILNQYAVGSSEAIFMYSGSIILDANGRVTVNLPDYFDKINRNPRIQLTGVGSPDVVYVAEKIKDGRFVVGGKPGMEVYWTVTAERKDIHAEIARTLTPVEQQKTGDLRDHSLDDDAMIGIYDGIKQKNPDLFKFKTEEGRSVHEQSKIVPKHE